MSNIKENTTRYKSCGSGGNNPILYNDVLGDTVKFAGKKESLAYTSYKGTINSKIGNINSKIAKFESKGKTKKVKKLKKQLDTYVGIMNELTTIENSTDVFRIRFDGNSSNPAGGGNISFNNNTGEVDINVRSTPFSNKGTYSTQMKFAHELKHAYQFTQGIIDLTNTGKGGYAYDNVDEYQAFYRQNLFSTIENMETNVVAYVDKHYSGSKTQITIYDAQYPLEEIQNLQYQYAYYAGTYPKIITTGYQQRYNQGVSDAKVDALNSVIRLQQNIIWSRN